MKHLLLLLLMAVSAITYAQDKKKTDQIFLNNGSKLEVHVTKVNDNTVEFTYPNETVQNSEAVSKIRTIVFASGRVQQFNTNGSTASESEEAPEDKSSAPEMRAVVPNTLAILPVAFYDDATGELYQDKSKLAQSRIFDFFEDEPNKIAPLKLQDSRSTNAYLKKANISYAELDETPIQDIQNIIGADYLVLSKVNCKVKTSATANETTYAGKEKKGGKEVAAVHTSSSVNENKSYEYMVVLEIYKNGEKIYNETRKPFLNMEDSWKDAYEYMLKRTPIYKRK